MATSARTGFGLLWQRGDGGSPEAFVTVAEVTSLTFEGAEHPTIDVTNNDSASAACEKIKRGFTDYGRITINFNFTGGATHKNLYGANLTGITPTNYKLTWPGIALWGPISAFLSKMGPIEGPHDNTMTGQATYDINSLPTLP